MNREDKILAIRNAAMSDENEKYLDNGVIVYLLRKMECGIAEDNELAFLMGFYHLKDDEE